MKPLTIDHIIKNSVPHPLALSSPEHKKARMYHEKIGDYTLSIVGGGKGLYGNFETTFEVALIDNETGDFVTDAYSRAPSGGGVIGYASIDDINDLYFNIPRRG